MKNKVIYAVLAAMFPLVGCTQSGSSGGSPELVEGTVGISVPAEVKAATDTDDATEVRYIMQAWTVGENGTSGELAFEYVWPGRTVGEGVKEPVRMIPGVYNILFWADRDADGSGDVYNAEDLNNVRVVGLQSGGSGTGENSYVSGDERDAFCGVLRNYRFTAGAAMDITLSRPLAKVVVANASAISSSQSVSLKITGGLPLGYDVLKGQPLTDNTAAQSLTIDYGEATSGNTAILTDYFFPPVSSAPIEGTLKVGEAEQTLSLGSEDIVANYTTNITLNLNIL
ncbi:MAG TPA: hypothetical protein IAC05_04535 [Candidatus Coprenecus stercorigallinarum]|nr:hypothetical protein [Candidatus Coprenecus stercorigallinarum]